MINKKGDFTGGPLVTLFLVVVVVLLLTTIVGRKIFNAGETIASYQDCGGLTIGEGKCTTKLECKNEDGLPQPEGTWGCPPEEDLEKEEEEQRKFCCLNFLSDE